MIQFKTIIKKFQQQGEKTGWTYIEIPATIAEQLLPDNKKSFRVKGKLDDYPIEAVALIPMGESNFIMPLNATIRKAIKKQKNDSLFVKLEVDKKGYVLNEELMNCLKDEPKADAFFKTLSGSHQKYFSKWIESAKTMETKTRRIAMAVNALSKHWGFPEMLKANKKIE